MRVAFSASDRARKTWLLVLPWELKEPGGVSQVVQNLFEATQTVLGHRSLLFVNTWGQREPSFAEVDGRATVRAMVRSPLAESRSLRHLLSFMVHLPKTVLVLRRMIRDEHIERINIHYPGLDALVWVLAARLAGTHRPEVVLSFHGSDLRDARATRGLGRRLWSWLLRSADDITACAEALRGDITSTFGASARNTRVVHNGVDPALIARLGQGRLPDQCPPNFVLSLATVEHKKGLDVLMRAFDAIARQHPELSLVLAGRVAEPQYFEKLKALKAQLPCGERICFMPGLPHDQAMAVLSRARALALASRQEPFGIVILEAGVLGIPVAATNICGAVRLLDADHDLVAVPPEDQGAMAQALQRLLTDPQLCDRLAQTLRQRVLADFTWECAVMHYSGRDAATAPRHSANPELAE